MPIKKCYLIYAVAMAVLFCNRDYNPFTDPSNARVFITSWSFEGRDSVPLFETGTCRMAAAAREMIDSFVISVPKNRYWQDTVVRISDNEESGEKGSYYQFEVSFFDTGLQSLTLTTYRANGEVLKEQLDVRVYNPLKQRDIIGFFGDTIDLFTPPVSDEKRGVVYHWRMGGSWEASSVVSLYSAYIQLFSPQIGKGYLWVSDLSGSKRSPAVEFGYSFNDTAKPVIKCINEGLEGHTIFTADTVFAFKVLITDVGSAGVDFCSVNGKPFDFVNRSSGIYTKLFENLPASSPLKLEVLAIDNMLFENSAYDTFIVIFDPNASKSDRVTLTFYHPDKEISYTSQRSYMVYGSVQSNYGDTMFLLCSINDRIGFNADTIIGAGEWSWVVPVDSLSTTVSVSVYNLQNQELTSAKRLIVFDPEAGDSIKPMIWEISTEDKHIGSRFYTPKSSVTLKIVAFDEGSGLASLSVNGDLLPVDSSSYVWWWNTDNLAHNQEGNPVRVTAIDKKNNREERSVIIYRNSQPVLISDLIIPAICCAESVYTTSLYWRDADNDPVRLDTIRMPQGMVVSQEGAIRWKPVLRGPGEQKDTLILELFDGYEKNRYLWTFSCKQCARTASSLKFMTTEKDFPQVVQVGVERLNIRLSIDSTNVSFIPKYRAVFIDNGKTILNNDTSGIILWTPSAADTGYRRLMITVGDGTLNFDTLFPAFWVVPRNQYPCSLSVFFSGETTPAGILDLFTHPEPETLYFTIHDQDHPLTEICTVTVSLGTVRTVQILKQNSFLVAIEPDTTKIIEALTVKIRDRTGTGDSMQFIIQYDDTGANIPPIVSSAPDFPVYCCADSFYEFHIKTFDPEGGEVKVITLQSPPGMTISETGLIYWVPSMNALGDDSVVIRLFDGKDSSGIYKWMVTALDCNNLPPPVKFKTKINDFPSILQADIDSISLRLELVAGSGVKPFLFRARLDNNQKILEDTIGALFWVPSGADTGTRILGISVRDRYKTFDTLSVPVTVVARNCSPCSLSYTYSGPILSTGELYIISSTVPESAYFVISDADHPATERYIVSISRRGSATTTQKLNGSKRSFAVLLNTAASTVKSRDTIFVSVNDSTGTTYSVILCIRYPIENPDSIPDMVFYLNAASGVTTQPRNLVSSWSYETGSTLPRGGRHITLSQSDRNRMPTLVQKAVNGQPAILFDHQSDNGDDGLSTNDSYLQWADTPFTVFIVFSARSLQSAARQSLVTTNTVNGFGMGITCDNTIGILNDVAQNNCSQQEWAGTDLKVDAKAWYIATYQSSLGITVGSKIKVLAWLNGTAASQPMELTTQSNEGMAVGTGSTGYYSYNGSYNGSFDGWIAAIILYSRALSNDERFLVERYLGNLYGITVK